MRPHNGAVEHRIFVVGIGGEMLEDLLPDPGFGPPSEPAMGILPVAQALRQIAPRDAGAVAIEHRLDEATIVLSGRANRGLSRCPRVINMWYRGFRRPSIG